MLAGILILSVSPPSQAHCRTADGASSLSFHLKLKLRIGSNDRGAAKIARAKNSTASASPALAIHARGRLDIRLRSAMAVNDMAIGVADPARADDVGGNILGHGGKADLARTHDIDARGGRRGGIHLAAAGDVHPHGARR